MKNRFLLFVVGCCLVGGMISQSPAQVVEPPTPPGSSPPGTRPSSASPTPSPATKPGSGRDISTPIGQEIPVFDPGTEVVTWGGRFWNISDNRIFRARFEKYLSAPELTTDEHREYQKLIREIMDLVSPENPDSRKLYPAVVKLIRAGTYDVDANMCNTLGGAVITAMQAQRNQNAIALTIQEMQREIQHQQSRATMFAVAQGQGSVGSSTRTNQSQNVVTPNEMRQGFAMKESTALQAQITALTAKREISALQARLQFQALMLQMFIQRRFQHVVIATQLYRMMFPEGDASLKLEGQAKEFFHRDIGVPPTVSTLQSLATEAMRDVREGVKSYHYLVDNNEMESATKRLQEAFLVGEHMPEIRTLPREKKRLALMFMQKSTRLLSALEVRDYTLADQLIKELDTFAKDFDLTKPRAAIQTARAVSGMHLAKARNAALAGNKETFEQEIHAAATIWPLNPSLAEMSGTVFAAGDVQAKALADFDQLYSQRNYRQIFNDKLRFIVAAATSPDHQDKLRQVLDDMQSIETAVAKAEELGKRGDPSGAWEAVERAIQRFPDDVRLNQLRGNLSAEAATFVQSLKTAQQLESQGQTGSSLAWYLKAQRQYPLSEFAREGINRLVAKLLPNS